VTLGHMDDTRKGIRISTTVLLIFFSLIWLHGGLQNVNVAFLAYEHCRLTHNDAAEALKVCR
jgi:hypothetical protein